MKEITENYLAGYYCHCQTWDYKEGWINGYINGEEATRVKISKRDESCKVLILDTTKPDGSNDQRVIIPHGTGTEERDNLIKSASLRADQNRTE